jgi:hypothetical protein
MKMDLWGVLATIFVVLKLVGVIDWSWWVVLSPLLGWVVVFVLFLWDLVQIGRGRGRW